ncbi:MAG TPA: hypothetical protein VHZ76_02090 [Gammaproteobacteria bacterium]|jgi:hypothetical protein|nr:hypothetical protein [Gammaproteobacteria bacterium]
MKTVCTLLSLMVCLAVLSACSTLERNRKSSVCNQLNTDIIFNGATSDTRTAEIQNAQQTRLMRAYENNNCGE